MVTATFNVAVIETLQLTSLMRPVSINLVPVYATKITLLNHLVLLEDVAVLEVTQFVITADEVT